MPIFIILKFSEVSAPPPPPTLFQNPAYATAPITSNAQACRFADYFSSKIEQIFSGMSYQNCNSRDIDFNVVESYRTSRLRNFGPQSLAGLKATIEPMPSTVKHMILIHYLPAGA